MKIVINRCFGGFGLSPIAIKEYLKLKGKECFFYKQTKYNINDGTEEYSRIDNPKNQMSVHPYTKDLGEKTNCFEYNEYYFHVRDIERNDQDLISVVEELGESASGWAANLQVIEIPDDVDWEISDYDGLESVEEKHRSW